MAESDPRVERLLGQVARDHWTAPLHGGLPQVPRREALPTAGVDYWLRMIAIPGDGSTTPDVVYVCLRDASGVYHWETAATG